VDECKPLVLGTMQGGYNIETLIAALDVEALAPMAADKLSFTILMFDSFHDVEAKAKAGNPHAARVMKSWAGAYTSPLFGSTSALFVGYGG